MSSSRLTCAWVALTLTTVTLVGCGGASTDPGSLRDLNGTQLFVREMGDGAPLIVVHGGPLLEHGYFLPHLEPLAEDNRLVFYDQRLSGRSAAEADPVSMDAFVEDIEALRVSIGAEQIHLMAHSWGGHLAMRYAIAHPERLSSLVLVSPMAASSELWQQEEQAMAGMATAADQADRTALMSTPAFSRFEPAAIEELMRISFRPQVRDVASLDALNLYFPADYAQRSQTMSALGPEMMDFDFRPQLAQLDVPTLLVYGEVEVATAIGGAALLEAMPSAELVTIRDAGHFSFAEQPEEFLAAVRGFLGAR